ncbi:MAG: hypothetical protein OEO77_03555, partial [Acidimicrobiia bacterium]|nr:hypothetical protein [Acidimicrobiia bacterium]
KGFLQDALRPGHAVVFEDGTKGDDMNNRRIALLGVAALVVVACGGDAAVTTTIVNEAVATTLAPTPTSTPTSTSSAGGDANTPSSGSAAADALLAADNIDSYSHRFSVEFSGIDADGQDVTRSFTVVSLFQKEPPASSVSAEVTGFDDPEFEAFGSYGFTVLDGVTYASVPGFGCTTNPPGISPDSFLSGAFLTPDSALNDLEGVDKVGSTTYEGFDVDEYEFDETDMDLAPEDELEQLTGRFLYSPELAVVLFFEFDGEGTGFFEEGDMGTIHTESAVTGINEPVDIQVPEGCDASGQTTTDLPILADASGMFSAPGLTSYQTNETADAVLAFYKTELVAAGWEQSQEPFSAAGNSIVEYQLGNRTLVVTVATSGTKRTVTLIEDQ